MSTNDERSSDPLLAFSNQIAALVEAAAGYVVAVHAGRHESVSGTSWRSGVIVTVAHALRHGGDVTITLPDGRQTRAQLAGVDASTDLAVLRTDEAPPAARLGDAAAVRTGHWVVAVARGGHGEIAADQGIVGRAGPAWQTWRGGHVDRLLRLDGGLQAGFSGAPIVAADGGVIGIGTAALARGYGIVLPVPTVERVTDALLTHGRIARGYLGIGTQPVELPAATAQKLQLDNPRGLLITSIADDSPAERAGWLIGDILLRLGEHTVHDLDSLHFALGGEHIGERVRARSVRGGAMIETEVQIGERPRRHC
ncbi:MAG TPA: trypsin-like peptidase domain-containing protein [Burkholderiaceae bacterium]|nr:trypsin-like peptidase domain-containing protein [Burkholderiaceae bacterium]